MAPELLIEERDASSLTEPELVRMTNILTAAFDRWPGFDLSVPAVEHLRWKLEGASSQPTRITTSHLDGELVGFSITYPRTFRVNGTDRTTKDGGDLVIHPDFQGRGLERARRAHRPADAAQPYEIGVGVSTFQPRGHRVRKRPLGNPIRVLALPYRIRCVVRTNGWRGLRIAFLASAAKLKGAGSPRGAAQTLPNGLSLVPVERFDQRVNNLFDIAAEPFDFIQVRDQRYLNWRYCDARGGAFTVVQAEEAGRLLGYVASKVTNHEGMIVDLQAHPARADVAYSLIAQALEGFEARGVDMVTCWTVRGHPHEALLHGLGFVKTGDDVGYLYRARRIDPSQLAFMERQDARIHLMPGDADYT